MAFPLWGGSSARCVWSGSLGGPPLCWPRGPRPLEPRDWWLRPGCSVWRERLAGGWPFPSGVGRPLAAFGRVRWVGRRCAGPGGRGPWNLAIGGCGLVVRCGVSVWRADGLSPLGWVVRSLRLVGFAGWAAAVLAQGAEAPGTSRLVVAAWLFGVA